VTVFMRGRLGKAYRMASLFGAKLPGFTGLTTQNDMKAAASQ
jgi:hypothetical protein